MELKDLITVCGQLGFPAVVALYLLVRFERKLGDLTTAIQRVTIVCERIEARDSNNRKEVA